MNICRTTEITKSTSTSPTPPCRAAIRARSLRRAASRSRALQRPSAGAAAAPLPLWPPRRRAAATTASRTRCVHARRGLCDHPQPSAAVPTRWSTQGQRRLRRLPPRGPQQSVTCHVHGHPHPLQRLSPDSLASRRREEWKRFEGVEGVRCGHCDRRRLNCSFVPVAC